MVDEDEDFKEQTPKGIDLLPPPLKDYMKRRKSVKQKLSAQNIIYNMLMKEFNCCRSMGLSDIPLGSVIDDFSDSDGDTSFGEASEQTMRGPDEMNKMVNHGLEKFFDTPNFKSKKAEIAYLLSQGKIFREAYTRAKNAIQKMANQLAKTEEALAKMKKQTHGASASLATYIDDMLSKRLDNMIDDVSLIGEQTPKRSVT